MKFANLLYKNTGRFTSRPCINIYETHYGVSATARFIRFKNSASSANKLRTDFFCEICQIRKIRGLKMKNANLDGAKKTDKFA